MAHNGKKDYNGKKMYGGSEHPKSSRPADCGAREAYSKASGPASSKEGASFKTPYKHREYSK